MAVRTDVAATRSAARCPRPRPARSLRSSSRTRQSRHGPLVGAVSRMADHRVARGGELLLHGLPVRPRTRHRPAPTGTVSTMAALASREMDRHRALRRGALYLRALRSLGPAPRDCLARSWATSHLRSRSISCSPERPSASTSARSVSSVSWRQRCRRSNCRCESPRRARRVEPSIASRDAATRSCRLGCCAADASWRSSSRPRSETSIAPFASTACRHARTTTSRWRPVCRDSSWQTRAADPESDGCRDGATSRFSPSSSSSAG